MSFKTEFLLLRQQTQGKKKFSVVRFEFKESDLKMLTDDAAEKTYPGPPNKLERRFFKKQLSQVLPSDKRTLDIILKLDTLKNPADGGGMFCSAVDIFVEGEILKRIWTLLSPKSGETVGLELNAELSVTDRSANPERILLTQDFGIQLQPQITDGVTDHSKYTCLSWRLDQLESLPSVGIRGWKLNVKKLSLFVVDLTGSLGSTESSQAVALTKGLLAEAGLGRGGDVEIVTKDKTTISCHGVILKNQSPVMEKMLTEGHFAEGSSRKIEMPEEWTGAEANAFISFLYYGRVEEAVKDPSTNLTLFKMGEYFQVSRLKETMREILLYRLEDSVSVDVALGLFSVARLLNDQCLIRKAVDALALRTDAEIQESALFNNTIGRHLFMSSRSRGHRKP